MERIKEALEEARRERQKSLLETTLNRLLSASSADVNDLIDARRIRERSPFSQLNHERQQAALAAGQVVRFDSGQHVFVIGDTDDHVHYLLEGAVSVTGHDTPPQTLYAYQEAALFALDEPGLRYHTVTAVIPSRIFRIAHSFFEDATPARAVPPPEAEPALPREMYAETFSGEQLAQLVEAIHEDRARLSPDIGPTKERIQDDVRFGDNTLGVNIDKVLAELDPTPAVMPSPASPAPSALPNHEEISDEIGRFTRELEARFRRYVEQVRAEERKRAQTQLQVHAKRLRELAEAQLKGKIITIRDRYQAAYIAKEKQLRERYEHLIAMANKMTRQKAAIYQARRQLEDKLRLAEQVHNELAQIGLTVTRQLNDLEGMIEDEPGSAHPAPP